MQEQTQKQSSAKPRKAQQPREENWQRLFNQALTPHRRKAKGAKQQAITTTDALSALTLAQASALINDHLNGSCFTEKPLIELIQTLLSVEPEAKASWARELTLLIWKHPNHFGDFQGFWTHYVECYGCGIVLDFPPRLGQSRLEREMEIDKTLEQQQWLIQGDVHHCPKCATGSGKAVA